MSVSLTLSDTFVVRVDTSREIECLVCQLFLACGQGLLAGGYLVSESLRRFALDVVEQRRGVGESLLRHLRIAGVVSTNRLRCAILRQAELWTAPYACASRLERCETPVEGRAGGFKLCLRRISRVGCRGGSIGVGGGRGGHRRRRKTLRRARNCREVE